MEWLWLCILSLALAGLVFVYLSKIVKTVDEPEEVPQADTEEDSGEEEKKPFPFRKYLPVYGILVLLVLIGLSIELTLVFPDNPLIQNIRLLTLLAFLFAAAYVDAEQKIIPNKLVVTALIVRLLLYVTEFIVLQDVFLSLVKSDLIALLIPLFFLLIGVVLMKNGMGMGDIKLLIVICFYLGLQGSVSAVFFSLVVAFVISIVLLIAKKKGRKDSIPFAPALMIGTAISLFMSGM